MSGSFHSFHIDCPDSIFESLRSITGFEDVTRGRDGTVLVGTRSAGGGVGGGAGGSVEIPIVRTIVLNIISVKSTDNFSIYWFKHFK